MNFVQPDLIVIEKQEEQQSTKLPPMYQVLLLNDDFTPMDFVILVLQKYFHKDLEQATQIMLIVHHQGKCVCGMYTRDIAQTKVEQVLQHAKNEGYPLQCIMEEV